MSNQDEDEVEDELEAMEKEISGPVALPDAPQNTILDGTEDREKEREKRARAKARAREAVPMEA